MNETPPTDGAALLDAVHAALIRYVVLPTSQGGRCGGVVDSRHPRLGVNKSAAQERWGRPADGDR